MSHKILWSFLFLLQGVAFVYALFFLRLPSFLPFVRPWDALVVSVISLISLLGLLCAEHFFMRKQKYILGILAILTLGITVCTEGIFQYKKYVVLHSSIEAEQPYSNHFIVGYSNFAAARRVVQQKGVAGLYISSRNVRGKTKEEIYADIASLQAIRRDQGLKPLHIMTDQEGGIVERVSPPLPHQEPLSAVSERASDVSVAVKQYATSQAEGLKELGITVNLAPVVDLQYSDIVENDRYSHIAQRALSSDPAIVSSLATIYAQTLIDHQIIPVLKHFPGLGRASHDTHVEDAVITASLEELTQDLHPFFEVSGVTDAWIMVSHAIVPAIDPEYPLSLSDKTVKLIRDNWKRDALLITDDFSMRPISHRPGGVGEASQRALTAGVDYILIAYDHDLYYEAMYALLKNQTQ